MIVMTRKKALEEANKAFKNNVPEGNVISDIVFGLIGLCIVILSLIY
jgi:hypothetical protein